MQLHHVLAENPYPQFAKVAENLIGVCVTCHSRHEGRGGAGGFRRIPRQALPAVVIDFVNEQDLGWYLDRYYPVAA